jgi:myo-inositol-1(or 4)-monophosphatase
MMQEHEQEHGNEIDMRRVCAWAREGGAIARGYFNSVQGQRKADQSLVSQADIEIEQMLRDQISGHYPEHGIVGEEEGSQDSDREYVWCLDPLDGTEAFLCGLPIWAVSIGIFRHKEPYRGVVYLPATDECYWNDAQGAFWNGKPIHVSEKTSLERTDWIINHSRTHLDYVVTFPGKMRSFGSFAAHFCYVARASTPAALIGRPQLWDAAAGLAILQSAGGVTTMLPDGAVLDPRVLFEQKTSSMPLLASPPALVGDLVRYIKMRQPS